MAYRRAGVAGVIAGVLAIGSLSSAAHAQKQSLTWERRMPGGQWPDTVFGLFADPTADQLVVFGRGPSGEVAIWIWDEAAGHWTRQAQRPSVTWPAGRAGATMAHDSRRRAVFMFGGLGNTSGTQGAALHDLREWSFESQSWTQLDMAPLGRSDGAMAFDERRGVLVLFGGIAFGTGGWTSDLLEWNPGTGRWTQRIAVPAGAIWPPPLDRPAIAFDPSRSRIVVLGSDLGPMATTSRPVWEWDGTDWTVSTPRPGAPAPAPWLPARLVFDPTRTRMLALGTETDIIMSRTTGLRLWEWRSAENAWALLPFDSVPSASTPGSVAFDTRQDRIVSFGNVTGATQLNDLLELDMASGTWRNRTPVWPDNSYDACAAYDPIRRVTVLFGGTRFHLVSMTATTLEWDGPTGSWGNRTPAVTPVAWPMARAGAAMVYDTLHEGVLMFGGRQEGIAPINDLWIWNGDSGLWSEISREDAAIPWPVGRTNHAMAWDHARNVLVVHGGLSAQALPFADTWEWDGRRRYGRTAAARRRRAPGPATACTTTPAGGEWSFSAAPPKPARMRRSGSGMETPALGPNATPRRFRWSGRARDPNTRCCSTPTETPACCSGVGGSSLRLASSVRISICGNGRGAPRRW